MSAISRFSIGPLVLVLALLPGCGGDGQSGAADGVDRDLVGHWRNTRVAAGFVSEVYCNLAADGTFSYSGLALVKSPNVSPADGGTVTGRWKAEGGRLLSKPEGAEQWLEIGRYSLSGDSLLLTGPDGTKTYWER